MAIPTAIPQDTLAPSDAEGWSAAAAMIDELSPLFSPLDGFTRLLTLPHGNDAELLRVKEVVVAQLLRAPTLRAGFYRLAGNFYPGRLPTDRVPTPRELTAVFDFEVCAAFLAIVYFHRRATRLIANHSQWRGFVELAQHRGDIGFLLGTSLNDLGPATGLLVGTLRSLALGFIACRDTARFRPYQEHLVARKLSFDVAYELSHWGFSHAQVMSLFLQRLGYGRDLPIAIMMGLSPGRLGRGDNLRAERIRACSVWIDSVYRSAKPPTLLGDYQFGLSRGESEQLVSNVKVMIDSQTRTLWLDPRESVPQPNVPRSFL